MMQQEHVVVIRALLDRLGGSADIDLWAAEDDHRRIVITILLTRPHTIRLEVEPT